MNDDFKRILYSGDGLLTPGALGPGGELTWTNNIFHALRFRDEREEMMLGPGGLTDEFDPIIKEMEGKYNFKHPLLKAVMWQESSGHADSYRYEPGYWKYIKDDPRFADKDPEVVSASYGLMQLMYPVAVELGFQGNPTGLYDPAISLNLGAMLLRNNVDAAWKIKDQWFGFNISAMDIALARYNGGPYKNPENGTLRNQTYVSQVFAKYATLGGTI